MNETERADTLDSNAVAMHFVTVFTVQETESMERSTGQDVQQRTGKEETCSRE